MLFANSYIMRSLIVILVFFGTLLVQPLFSQHYNYDFAVGLRIGLAYGLNAKYFPGSNRAIQSRNALEAIASHRYNGITCSILYEYHIEVFDTKGFYLYCGGGMHAGVLDSDKVPWETGKTGDNFYTGFDGIIGLEYVFAYVPVSIGLDWKPGLNFISDLNVITDDIGLSLRFFFD